MARKPGYTISASSDLSIYQFTSTGRNKVIEKRIEFYNTEVSIDGKYIYNLAFGDIDENGLINDEIDSNNGDIITIIKTVFSAVYDYTETYPGRYIYFKGSNLQRTQFYQTVLRRHYNDLICDFYIYGITETEDDAVYEGFNVNKNYHAFMVMRKLN